MVPHPFEVARGVDVAAEDRGDLPGEPPLPDLRSVGGNGLVDLVDALLLVRELRHQGVDVLLRVGPADDAKHVLDDIPHVHQLVLGGLDGRRRRGVEELLVQVEDPGGRSGLRDGQDRLDQPGELGGEGNEDDGVDDVEYRMGVGELTPDVRGRLDDHEFVEGKEGEEDGDAEKVEEHVGGGGLFRVAVGPEGGQHGRDGGADIVPQDDGDGCVDSQKPL